MSFGEQLKCRRKELGLSRSELAKQLGVSQSAVGNYETGVSAPKEEILLRIFDALHVEPNYLYRGSFESAGGDASPEERTLVEKYRALSPAGRQTIHTLLDALCRMQGEPARTIPLYRSPAAAGAAAPAAEVRTIPLYTSPAAAGFAAPVFGEDYELIQVSGDVPPGAELAVRMEGDSMAPYIPSGSVIYIHHAPLANGDVGLFCIGGAMLVRQYIRGEGGAVRLLPLNRTAGEVLTFPTGGVSGPTCFGRALLRTLPLPESAM